MKQQLLLLEDVDGLGRSGDIVSAKPGHIRNFLIPSKKGVIASKQTLKMQARLKEEREKKAAVDRKESEKIAAQFADLSVSIEAKVDPSGRMYGSVSPLDIARLLQEQGHQVERKNVVLVQPIKTLGTHVVNLTLKEGVPASFKLDVTPEGGVLPVTEEKVEEPEAVEAEEEAKEEA